MPIPKPEQFETENDFMDRCMSDSTMLNEYGDRTQRFAVCRASYREDEKNMDNILDFECKYIETDEDGSFEGYASVFNNKDLGNDVIKKGAFARTIMEKNPKQIKLLYQHKTDEPIGVVDEIEEDNKGLKIKGRLAIKTQKGREVYELMKMGALDSMSIGYKLMPDSYKYDDKNKRRVIKEVDLMEVSMVTFPMNPKAKITKVKLEDMSEREIEQHLRDAGVFSQSIAKQTAVILHKCYSSKQCDVVDSVKQLINTIKN